MTKVLLKRFSIVFCSFLGLLLLLLLLLPTILNTSWAKEYVSIELSEALGRTVELSGEIALALGTNPTLEVASIAIENSPWASREKLLHIRGLSVSGPLLKNLLGEYQIDSFRTNSVALEVAENDEGYSNWKFNSLPNKKSDELSSENSNILFPQVSDLKVNDISIALNLGDSPRELRIERLNVSSLGMETKTKLSAVIALDTIPLEVTASLNGLGKFLGGAAIPVKLEVLQADTTLSASGSLQPTGAFEANVSLSGSNLASLSSLIGEPLPAFKDYALESDLSWSTKMNEALHFKDLDLKIGLNDAKGELQLILSPLTINGTLDSERLDLEEIVSATESQSEASAKEVSDDKTRSLIPYSAFSKFDADVKLKAKDLHTFSKLHFKDASLEAQVQGETLEVPSLVATAFGGTLEASIKASRENLVAKVKARELKSNPITVLAGGEPFFKGNFDLDLDVSAKGEKLAEIFETSNGTLSFRSEQATLASSTLQSVSSNLFSILSPIFGDSKEAKLECLLFNFTIENGIVKSEEQVLKLEDVFIFAEGVANLPKDSIKYNLHVNSKKPALVSLIPPFRAYGSIGDPSFAPSTSGAVASVFDTAEGLTESATGILGSVAGLFSELEEERTGIQLCHDAYELEQSRLSSKVGALLKGESRKKKTGMHPSWDKDDDGINDCEKNGSCDHTVDYSKTRKDDVVNSE